MDSQYDPETVRKIELINVKIDEINQRRMNLPTTGVEDELDRAELYEYVKTLNLNEEQKKILDRYCGCRKRSLASRIVRMAILAAGIVLQFFIGLEVVRLMTKGPLELVETLYLVVLAGFFLFNTVYLLRYLRAFK